MKKYAVVLNQTYSGKVIVEGVAEIRDGGSVPSQYLVRFPGEGSDVYRFVEPDNICPTKEEAQRQATTLKLVLADA